MYFPGGIIKAFGGKYQKRGQIVQDVHWFFFSNNVRQNLQYSTCGRCGETFGNRDASQGGRYDKGVIVATYTAGSRIQVETEFGATHGGQFHLELCAQQTETDNCFVPLNIVGGNVNILNNTACVDDTQSRINVQVQLPANVRCNR